jgi:hypothetical protein
MRSILISHLLHSMNLALATARDSQDLLSILDGLIGRDYPASPLLSSASPDNSERAVNGQTFVRNKAGSHDAFTTART